MNKDYLKKEIMFCYINKGYHSFCGSQKDILDYYINGTGATNSILFADIFVNKVFEVEDKNIQSSAGVLKEELIVQHLKAWFQEYTLTNFVEDGNLKTKKIEYEAENSVLFAESFLKKLSEVKHNGSYIIDSI